ncbi:MAG: hypothetical protein WD716_09790 [Fimbriimonadaceae bacterium]
MRRHLVLWTAVSTTALVAGVLVAAANAGPPCCQDAGLFEVPKKGLTTPTPPEGCTRATEQAWVLLGEVESQLSEEHKSAIRAAVADKDKDETTAEAWSNAGSVAFLNLHMPAALWAELNALKTEWSSDSMVQAGVYLALMKLDDDAKLMLHCAYDADNRSPYLLEALANIYHKAGDKVNAVKYIGEAQAAAPDDTIINLEKQSFNTGRPPTRPTPPADQVDAAMAELKAHINRNIAIMKRGEELRDRVTHAFTGERNDEAQEMVENSRQAFDGMVASLADPARLAKLTPAQFRQQFPGNPDSLRIQFRNAFFYSVITIYLSVSDNMLLGPRPAEAYERYDVGFWAKVINRDPVQYARMLKALRDFEYEGVKHQVSGYRLEDWYGAEFYTFFDYAGQKRREGHGDCMRRYSDSPSIDACILEVDKKYCATVRKLHENWMNGTEGHAQMIGRRFDGEASFVLQQAGEIAADAFEFASKYAKQMNVAPNDSAGQQFVRELNQKYNAVVANAVGDGTNGPAERMRFQENWYQIDKQNAETAITSYKQWIEEKCQPVDQRALEALLEEHRDAVRSMLLERLIRDLNVSWDPNADCSFSMGKWISVKIDIDGNVDVKGKWSPLKKAFDGSPTFNVNDKFKFDVKDARHITATATLEQSKNYGPFTGKGGINVGVSHDTQTGETTYPVKIEGKLGVGYKAKYRGQDFGVTCFPGSLKADFDARVVAKDVMDLYNAL